MILYLDTSALIKIYVNEAFSAVVLSALEKTNIAATHIITFVETQATFARLQREKKLTQLDFNNLKKTFTKDWENYLQVEITESLIKHAGDIAQTFALRAYDSVHLAAAHSLLKGTSQPVIFACFDQRLNQAATVLDLALLNKANN